MKFHPAILVLIIALGLMGCPKTDDTTPPITVTDDAGQDITADADEEDAEPVLDAEIHLPGPGQIIVSPTSLTYKDVRLGDSVDETITIRNTGTGPLTIEDLSLAQSTVRNGLEIKRGDQWLEGFTVIEPNTFRDITVRYEPNDYVTDRGSLKILSDDPDEPMVEVRIETINAYPDMEAPTSLRFGTVAVGDHILEPFVIYNRGGDPLNISAITYEGSDSFVVEYPGADPIPAHLARNEHLIVHIRYTPENDDVDHGKIILSTNDPDDEEFEILLTGNGPTPCISVSGDVDFGEPEVGERVTEQVTLLNCSGTHQLSILDVAILDDGAGTFELVGDIDLPISLTTLQTTNFQVAATASTDQEIVGLLQILSTDPGQEELELTLRVKGIDGE